MTLVGMSSTVTRNLPASGLRRPWKAVIDAALPLTVGWAALTVYLGFQAGGFFPDSTAAATLIIGVVFLVRTMVVARPFQGIGGRALVAVAAIVLYALWTLLSSAWSHANGRALIEFDRALLYALTLTLFASIPRRPVMRQALARGTVLGGLVLCGAGLATRTLPTTFSAGAQLLDDRLSYPLTYWNASGLLASITGLLCIGLAASNREPRAIRILAAALVPIPAATLLLTYSRGSIAVGVVGAVVLVAFGGPRRLMTTLLSTGPAVAVAMVAAYSADALGKPNPTSPAAVSQGRHLIVIIAACCVGAGILRALLSRWDVLSERVHPRGEIRKRGAVAAVAITVLAAGIGVGLAAGGAGAISREYKRFLHGSVNAGGSQRARLLNPANNGRINYWRVALRAFREQPLHGTGAGTYQLVWERDRPVALTVVNAHSLYLETMGDLGLVGLVLLLVALVSILAALVRRRSDRALIAALLAAAVAWLLEAGIDWMWQMPVVTLWLFAVGGLVLARRETKDRSESPLSRRPLLRTILGLGIIVVAITPARIGLSQVRLNESVAAFRHGNCPSAVSDALGSLSALGTRAEPFEILGYCDARAGLGNLAATMIANAVTRDAQNWEYHYDLALVRGAFGRDPRADAANALRLNPLAYQARDLVQATRSPRPAVWESVSRQAPLLIQ